VTLPLSRILQPSDAHSLPGALQGIVHDRFETRAPQHNARKIEYATVLAALQEMSLTRTLRHLVDIGGAGSPLPGMVGDLLGVVPAVIDPAAGGLDLHAYLQTNPHLCDVVLCVSVLEHVKDERQMLYDLAQLVVPGGWLVLTMDYGATQPDTYHFHWMRERIYAFDDLLRVTSTLGQFYFTVWGSRDYVNAPTDCLVHDYNFVSLIVQKAVTA
jgi:SAM-dependent methyltransferase